MVVGDSILEKRSLFSIFSIIEGLCVSLKLLIFTLFFLNSIGGVYEHHKSLKHVFIDFQEYVISSVVCVCVCVWMYSD